jgi:hypothetical protein
MLLVVIQMIFLREIDVFLQISIIALFGTSTAYLYLKTANV